MTDDLVVTLDEAAEQLDVSPSTIRTWVLRGHLEPLVRGARPLRFRASAVWACAEARRSQAERNRIATLARRWADTHTDGLA